MPYKPKSHSEKQKADSRNAWRYKDNERPNAQDRGYGSAWQKARKFYLKKHPLCADCAEAGRTTVATEVHHTIKPKGDKKIFWNSKLWRPLCKPCHSHRTGKGE